VVSHPFAVEASEVPDDPGFAPEHLGRVGWVGVVKDAQLGVLGVEAQGQLDVALLVSPAQGLVDVPFDGLSLTLSSTTITAANYLDPPSTRLSE